MGRIAGACTAMTLLGNIEINDRQDEALPFFLPVRMLNEFAYCARLSDLG